MGSKPLKKKQAVASPEQMNCLCCNKSYNVDDYYMSDSDIYRSIGRIPYCKLCLDNLYYSFFNEYKQLEYNNPERKAVERVCMALDIYYNDKIFDTIQKQFEAKPDTPLIVLYMKHIKLYQYRKKNYNTTINEKIEYARINNINETIAVSMYTAKDEEQDEIIETATKFFGSGFSNEDYMYLYEQYSDWTARHECETKSQEEIFKRLCFTQLELLKATRNKEDTKDLNATYLKQLEAAKLQPKQNKGETVSDTQTFGTLIDKWENTRPIPEIDEDLRDVDKIGKYVNIFFKGHLSKMMGIRNSFCKAYEDFMKKYSVQKPEYESEDGDSEALFDALFGGDLD